MQTIEMVLKSCTDWSNTEKANELAGIFISEDSFILPDKYDQHEPERFTFDPDNLAMLHDFWTSPSPCVLFTRKRPYPHWLNLTIARGKRFNEILSSYDVRYLKNADELHKLSSFATRLYEWGSIDHGYICHKSDWESKNRFNRPMMVNRKPVMGGGNRLRESLPGIYWINFFGPVYVKLIGENVFDSLSPYGKKRLPDGGYLIMTSESPFDYDTSETQIKEKEIIRCLGENLFFDKSHPEKQCVVPPSIKEYAG